MNTPKSLTSLTASKLAQTLPTECLDHVAKALNTKVYLVLEREADWDDTSLLFTGGVFSSLERAQEAVRCAIAAFRRTDYTTEADFLFDVAHLNPQEPTSIVYIHSFSGGHPIVSNDWNEFLVSLRLWTGSAFFDVNGGPRRSKKDQLERLQEGFPVDSMQAFMQEFADRGWLTDDKEWGHLVD